MIMHAADGPSSSLAGSTLLSYRRGLRNSSRPLRLDTLYRKFHQLPATSRGWIDEGATYLHSFDLVTAMMHYRGIADIRMVGFKSTIRVSTLRHGSVILTEDNLLMIVDGTFRPAGDVMCQELLCRGDMHPGKAPVKLADAEARIVVEGLKFYRSGWVKKVRDQSTGFEYMYKRQHKARLVVEAHMNNMDYCSYINRLKTDPAAEGLVCIEPGLEVHHRDENPLNDELANLAVMTKANHTREHSDERRFNVAYTAIDRAAQIERHGRVMAYEVVMREPADNFCVGGGG